MGPDTGEDFTAICIVYGVNTDPVGEFIKINFENGVLVLGGLSMQDVFPRIRVVHVIDTS